METEKPQASAYMISLARTDTEKSINEKYNKDIEKINSMIQSSAKSCKTWVSVTEKDVSEIKGSKGGSLAWYYSLYGYKTKWYNETGEIKISWK